MKRQAGEQEWLFPLVAPDVKHGRSAWSQWFGRYLSELGIDDEDKVFHSFRHGISDRLRQAGVDIELRKALVGWSTRSTMSGRYGAKAMLERYGAEPIRAAIESISYKGLDLSRVKPFTNTRPTRGPK